jgi:hypothetical protein
VVYRDGHEGGLDRGSVDKHVAASVADASEKRRLRNKSHRGKNLANSSTFLGLKIDVHLVTFRGQTQVHMLARMIVKKG